MIKTDRLTKRFGGLAAVNDVSFEVKRSEIFGLIGPNGAGKTTVLNLIAGMIPPTEGKVWLEESDITNKSVSKIARMGLARTFQSPVLFEDETVKENLLNAWYLPKCFQPSSFLNTLFHDKSVGKIEIHNALEFVGLTEDEYQQAGALPYGKQKALNLAMAIVTSPNILLMDEPAAGLNSSEKVQLAELIRRLRSELNITILIVEHDMKLIMNVCDRIMALSAGQVIVVDEPDGVRNNPDVIEAYLGATYEFT
ncbi:ABC transporter ATP-binding protein [Pusillimonas sp. ANT_WB101]|uniref:ABC transporter ATP-binding protein n=1 Tax=Pusillimonas sp. ANT_WB101 TaxID=2597356 RepID=UPI0011EC2458|nr:ABC transporter ATP-binding protein [Pusillimonas sp. ANT_WB101]KAA0893130.1 ABC transporter ATP-binding protein [Pusillimonas sp. ANT_WB101]